ncbi:VOC family protein [Streptomyces flavidovirens]|uniref:VOC family protein n=1 Tax=Streptomyces flavidovirens TaxID=67298 RepID=UPI0034281E22
MAAQPEGVPCWADAMFTDVEGAKAFYGDVLGWTFGEGSAEYGNYTQAYSDGKAVAAVVPPMPGQESPSAWCLYFASPDVAATARKITDNGGEVLMEPMQVGDFGSMLIAKDPGGATFGVWQAGKHEGFEKRGEPGAYAWAEVFTRAPEKSDAFFPAVFPYTAQRMEDDAIDFKFFTVEDCDAAVSRATERGGELQFGPMDSPFGRFAALTDPQGAAFAVIDMRTTKGEMPKMTAA